VKTKAVIAGAGAARTRKSTPAKRKPAKGKRKEQQRAIDTRGIILEAALTEFAQNGFDGASARNIAARAGVLHPLITYHYRTKDILWRAVAKRFFAEVGEQFDRRVPSNSAMSAVDRVREEFRTFLQFTIDHLDFHQFMLWESRPGSPRLPWLVENMLAPSMNRIVQHIHEAQDAGDLPAGDPALFYYMLIGCTSVLSSLRGEMGATLGLSTTKPSVVDAYWRLVDMTIFKR
jgi:TetR/AcrR family transcriptional regulator